MASKIFISAHSQFLDFQEEAVIMTLRMMMIIIIMKYYR